MDSQVKERIVGAAVLVALGVWLIPWVLDGQDESVDSLPGGDESVSAAAPLPTAEQRAPLRTETVELTREDSPRDQAAATPTRSADAPRDAAEEVPESANAAAPPAVVPETEAPAERTEAAARPGDWVVQLGAFSDPANAGQLASRVSTYGYTGRVSEYLTGGRTMHRVRIGGFGTRNEAEAAASSLAAHGFPARVVSPE